MMLRRIRAIIISRSPNPRRLTERMRPRSSGCGSGRPRPGLIGHRQRDLPGLVREGGPGPAVDGGHGRPAEQRVGPAGVGGASRAARPAGGAQALEAKGGGAGYEVMVDDSAHKDGTGTLLIGEISSLEEPHARALSEFAPAFGKAHMDYMRGDSSFTRRGAIQLIATRAPAEIKGKVDLKTGAKIYPDVPYLNKRMQVAREITIEIANKMGAEVAPQFPKSFRGIGGIGGIGHVCGTCCAGKDRRISVINEDFESHDVKGLFVVDASSYPRGAIFSGAICAIMGSFGAERIVKNYFSRGAGR